MNCSAAIPEQDYNQLEHRSNKLYLHDSKHGVCKESVWISQLHVPQNL